jgi:hypothetical protein
MKAKVFFLLICLTLSMAAIGQKEYALVDDLGEILAQEDSRDPTTKVLPIIFAKLEKKYSLKKLSTTMEGVVGDLIERRRKYTANRESGALYARAYDHLIASALTVGNNPTTYDQACDGLKKQLLTAIKQYQDALSDYQKCLNGENFSTAIQMESLDGLFGSDTQSDITTGATGDNCYRSKRSLKQAIEKVESLIRQADAACKRL